jgi:hypothetical protein
MAHSNQLARVLRLLEDEQRNKFYGKISVLLKAGNIVQVEVQETILTDEGVSV